MNTGQGQQWDAALKTVDVDLAGHGLVRLGAIYRAQLARPALLPEGCHALLLVGVTGSSFWPGFAASDEYRDGAPDPLDRWSQRVGGALAQATNSRVFYPFSGPPYWPFLGWARAAGAQPTPLGMYLHPQHGLWHAYRFALGFGNESSLCNNPEKAPDNASICAACTAQPCLQVCPVQAFDGAGYDVERCTAYLRTTPDAACHTQGCLARKACPQQPQNHYSEPHAAFHMQAFLQSRR